MKAVATAATSGPPRSFHVHFDHERWAASYGNGAFSSPEVSDAALIIRELTHVLGCHLWVQHRALVVSGDADTIEWFETLYDQGGWDDVLPTIYALVSRLYHLPLQPRH